MVRMKDIADTCGVSRTAVSFALNNRYDGNVKINDALRDKIKRTAKKMGYQPNRNAAALRKGRNPAIGVFLPPYRSELISDLVFGMSDVALEHHYPVFYSSGYSGEKFSQFLENAEKMSNSGIVIYFGFNDTIYQPEFRSHVEAMLKKGTLDNFPYAEIEAKNIEYYRIINDFVSRGGKVMLLNEVPERYKDSQSPVKYVACDDVTGGKIAAEHLCDRGCEQFYVLNTHSRCDRDRAYGFKEYLEAAGVVEYHSFYIWGRTPAELKADSFTAILEQIEPNKKITGLFISSDYMSIPVYDHFKARGIKIGRDIKIIGYDNLESGRYMTPGLTAVRQPFHEAGASAMENLITMLDETDVESQFIMPELIIREST